MGRTQVIDEVHRHADFFSTKWSSFCLWIEDCAGQLYEHQSRETGEYYAIAEERRMAYKASRRAKKEGDEAARLKGALAYREISRRFRDEERKMRRRLHRLQAKGWAEWSTPPFPASSFTTAGLFLPDQGTFCAPPDIVNPVLWVFGYPNPRHPDPDYQKEQLLLDCALLVVAHDATVTPTKRIYHQGTYEGAYFDCDSFCQTLTERLDALDRNGDLQRAWDDVKSYAAAYRDAARSAQIVVARMGKENPSATEGAGNRKPTPDCTHTADFSTVTWYGETFHFNEAEAKCIAALWAEWEKNPDGKAALHQKTIRRIIKSENADFRLIHVFRHKAGQHPAWGRMIHALGNGMFYLAKPTSSHTGKKRPKKNTPKSRRKSRIPE